MAEYGIDRYAGDAPPDLSALVDSAESEHFAFVQRTYSEWLAKVNCFDLDGEGFWVMTASALAAPLHATPVMKW